MRSLNLSLFLSLAVSFVMWSTVEELVICSAVFCAVIIVVCIALAVSLFSHESPLKVLFFPLCALVHVFSDEWNLTRAEKIVSFARAGAVHTRIVVDVIVHVNSLSREYQRSPQRRAEVLLFVSLSDFYATVHDRLLLPWVAVAGAFYCFPKLLYQCVVCKRQYTLLQVAFWAVYEL